MSKDRPVTIGSRTFQSQKTARAFFHGMLDRSRPGPVSEADARELLALVGGSAAQFTVVTSTLGTRTFQMDRDGASTLLSIGDCVARRRPSVLAEVQRALREAVGSDLEQARSRALSRAGSGARDDDGFVVCAATGDRILPADGHIDHRPPLTFEAITHEFLRGSIPALPLDEATLQAFRAHHAKVAQLAFVRRHVQWPKKA